MNMNLYIISSFLILFSACAPQAELVRTKTEVSDLREDIKTSTARTQDLQKRNQEIQKRLDALDANIKGTVDAQKTMADYGAKTDQLNTDIQLLQGRIEENNFRIAELAQKLDDRGFKVAELSGRVEELELKLKSISGGQGITSGTTGTPDKKSSLKALEPSEAYRQSLKDYSSGNYDLAIAGFQNYLAQFPDASQADKAQYGIGESFYAKKEFKNAIDAFSKVVKNYPKSDKVAGAKLKIGYSYQNQNQNSKAKEWLHRVIKEHPRSKEAELAKERIKKISR